ncbi:MAG: hypothetical protein JW925_02835 [Syntrophaceae bacterium]|nr:hypothetical protein [Syntrophaceae bacterium]
MEKTLCILIGFFLIVPTLSLAADKSVHQDKSGQTKTFFVKTATMHALGKVIKISDESIKIERIVKGDLEIMEFTLDEPAENICVNDFIKIDYRGKKGKLVALKVTKIKFTKP